MNARGNRKAGSDTMTTIVEVARLAGVSTSTVSHVINGTRHVEADTRQRVLDAIEKTSYRQDALARAMRRSRTDSIGIILSAVGEPAFTDMVHGVEHAATALGLTLLLANSAEDAARELSAVETLLERRVDGLILARAAASMPRVIELLSRGRTPVVLIDRIFDDLAFDQVGAENREPMRALVNHLIDAGHRRFAVIAGDTRVPTLSERLEGFRNAIRANILVNDEPVIIADAVDPREILTCVLQSLDSPHRPTAYIACGTVLAATTLEAFIKKGLSTPADVAFATFDGFSYPDLFVPHITTVRQPAFDLGMTAVELLKHRWNGVSHLHHTVRLPQKIEYRESTEAFVFG
jgi:LacI family transcriptional regulator